MKGGKQHSTPLSKDSDFKINRLSNLRTSEYVFPNLSNGQHLLKSGMSSVLKPMNKTHEWQGKGGPNISVHGFRSTFGDYIADNITFDGAVAEHALAQKTPGTAVASYQRQHRGGEVSLKDMLLIT
jgi:integrase